MSAHCSSCIFGSPGEPREGVPEGFLRCLFDRTQVTQEQISLYLPDGSGGEIKADTFYQPRLVKPSDYCGAYVVEPPENIQYEFDNAGGGGDITVTWDAVEDAIAYQIRWTTNGWDDETARDETNALTDSWNPAATSTLYFQMRCVANGKERTAGNMTYGWWSDPIGPITAT